MSDSYAIRQAELEAKRAAKDCQKVWLEERQRKGIVEYTDKRAVGWVRDVVLQLYGKEEWQDILLAVTMVAGTARTSPWRIRDMCYEIAAQRQNAEHASRILEEVGSAKVVRRAGLHRLELP